MILSFPSSFFPLASKWLEQIDGMCILEIGMDINEQGPLASH